MAERPKIVVAGILDTKGNEVRYLADRVRAAGGEPTIMELTVSGEVGWADIGVGELVLTIGAFGKKPEPGCAFGPAAHRAGREAGVASH